MSACYDSAEAEVVQRRDCAPKTREQVLSDLGSWKDDLDGEKVYWINGMAGTGKTTVLSAWIGLYHPGCAWLTLDERDNDPVRFLGYIIAALQKFDSHLG